MALFIDKCDMIKSKKVNNRLPGATGLLMIDMPGKKREYMDVCLLINSK